MTTFALSASGCSSSSSEANVETGANSRTVTESRVDVPSENETAKDTDTSKESEAENKTEIATDKETESNAELSEQTDIDPIQKAMKNMESVNSMEAQMIMDMDMSVSAEGVEQSAETSTIMDMVCFSDPSKLKVDMTMNMGEQQGTMNMKIYAEATENNKFAVYMYDGQNWTSQEEALPALEEYDARSSMMNYIGDASVYELAGEEQIDGINAYKYFYVLPEDEMKEAILTSGALNNLGPVDLDESQLDSMLDGLGDISTYVWIDGENFYPIRYEMDMTEVMDNLMSIIISSMGEQAEGVSMRIPEFKIVMTCFNFNNATDFTIPDEAKN